MIQAYFENIKDKLIEQIRLAKETITISVAWFTNKELFKELLDSMGKKAVKVFLLIEDDIINRGNKHGLDFQYFIDKGGYLFLHNVTNTLMHNKFCIIDKKIVITGSYNWTYGAEYNNKENIVISDDQELCQQFNDYFQTLKQNLRKEKLFVQIGYNQKDNIDTIYNYDELINELNYINDNGHYTCDQLIGELIKYKKAYSLTNHYKSARKFLTEDVGIAGPNDGMLVFFRKGTPLPALRTMDTYTIEGFTTNGDAEIFYGDCTEKIDDSKKVGVLHMTIPPKPAGEVTFKDTMFIDSYGLVRLSSYCIDTNEKISVEFDDEEIIKKFIS